ncbi:VOC family protein [Sneathiella sp.]|jgi:catechol 2,3-dioxygenase-like lactoylglutathione lyase family enzyme|uniref:VOC family protein n=1 Tax=Sneathiella sp. TaxID=1964365 RepID=UPI0039E46AB8
MAVDIGFTHVALAVTNVDKSIGFYKKYAQMEPVHQRADPETGMRVVWLSDKTRPFVLVLIEEETADPILKPIAHLGVGCPSEADVDAFCDLARNEGILKMGPTRSGPPVGYWAIISDPDGHSLELAYGQEIGLITQQEKDG